MIDKINEYIEDLLTVNCCPGHDYSCQQVYEYIKQLQSNWNSLREWINNTDRTIDNNFVVIRVKDVLDKMNELEGGTKKIMDKVTIDYEYYNKLLKYEDILIQIRKILEELEGSDKE